MNLQARKLHLIEYLIQLKDEKEFDRIESTILPSKAYPTKESEPFTVNEVIERAIKSDEDYKAGRIIAQDQLEKASDKW